MKYASLIPFLDKEDLTELAHKVIEGEVKGVKISTLYPFLDRNTLNELVDKMIEQKDTKNLKRAIPFISQERVNAIYEAIQKGDLEMKEQYLYPFMGSSKIKELFNDLVKKASEEADDDETDDEK